MVRRGKGDAQQTMQSGLEVTCSVVASWDGTYCVELTTPTGRRVVVGQFRSEQDARAWIDEGSTLPEDQA